MSARTRNLVQRANRSVDGRFRPAMPMGCTLATTMLVAVAALGTRAYAQCEQAKLVASDAACGDYFGASVGVEGEFAVIGAPDDDHVGGNAGSAYVFRKVGSIWTQQQKLLASDAGGDDRFSWGVSISQNRILVGAPFASSPSIPWDGFAYVFRWTGTTWVEEQKLVPLDPQPGGHFGWSVSLFGDVVAVAGIHEFVGGGDESGSVYMFRRTGTTWVQEQKLIPADIAPFDYFGTSVSVYNDVVVVGSRLDDPFGSAYVFRWNGATWVEEQKLTPSDGTRRFGVSVSIHGDRVVVGADANGTPAWGPGAAFVYRRTGGAWVEEQILTASDAQPGMAFGRAVSLALSHVLVGAALQNKSGPGSGAAYLFERPASTWVEVKKLTASDISQVDNFGAAVSLSDGLAIVGALGNDDASSDDLHCNSGSAYTYDVNECLRGIPAVSAWGVVATALLVTGVGVVIIRRRLSLAPMKTRFDG